MHTHIEFQLVITEKYILLYLSNTNLFIAMHFETFKPRNPKIQKIVQYYYYENIPKNNVREFICYPHFNSTISINNGGMKALVSYNNKNYTFQGNSNFEIYSRLRDKKLKVIHYGSIKRIVIVFHPLGIHYFKKFTHDEFKNFDNSNLFNKDELDLILNSANESNLVDILDEILESKLVPFENKLLDLILDDIINQNIYSVSELTDKHKISRRHLSRLFTEFIGVSTKNFINIVRFRNALNLKLFNEFDDIFTSIAYDSKFSDQSHLIRFFKKFTSLPPRKLLNTAKLIGKEDTFWKINK